MRHYAKRLDGLERVTADARPMTTERRAALYAQAIAKAGAPMPAADWSNADPATAAHRARMIAAIRGSNDND